ncbi:cupin domain-containing protein [Nannocystis pusilla]|uniref:Cupin domain-containing protein n=1 Tax=Nannocystis pusilla TaxID=889268 RepID=A0ABS7TZ49_9BACT|nr:cupin domain-containing protein [Nannocystis pusilla]MBZ5713564.1 cupin domain-containing protein [Nannocystis pusilla]
MPLWAGEDDEPAAAVAEAFTALSLALPPASPRSDARARLLAAVAAPEARFAPFVARLARLVDVAHERARELLASLARADVWQTVLPDVELVHLSGGPATAGADVGFVRIAAGATFPHHRHLGDERCLILQGGFVEDDGTVTRAGASTYRPAGTAHTLTALPGEDLVYAVVVFGVEFPGLPPRP